MNVSSNELCGDFEPMARQADKPVVYSVTQ